MFFASVTVNDLLISWQSVKSAYVKKFEAARNEHAKRMRHSKKKSRSHQKLSSKNSLADQLTVCL